MKMQKSVIFVKKNLKKNIWKIKNYREVSDHCHYTASYRGAAHNICNLKYSVPRKTSIVFYYGPSYDYHFIMNELAEEFKTKFTCLGETLKNT